MYALSYIYRLWIDPTSRRHLVTGSVRREAFTPLGLKNAWA